MHPLPQQTFDFNSFTVHKRKPLDSHIALESLSVWFSMQVFPQESSAVGAAAAVAVGAVAQQLAVLQVQGHLPCNSASSVAV
jgi:hypothetical protein